MSWFITNQVSAAKSETPQNAEGLPEVRTDRCGHFRRSAAVETIRRRAPHGRYGHTIWCVRVGDRAAAG